MYAIGANIQQGIFSQVQGLSQHGLSSGLLATQVNIFNWRCNVVPVKYCEVLCTFFHSSWFCTWHCFMWCNKTAATQGYQVLRSLNTCLLFWKKWNNISLIYGLDAKVISDIIHSPAIEALYIDWLNCLHERALWFMMQSYVQFNQCTWLYKIIL